MARRLGFKSGLACFAIVSAVFTGITAEIATAAPGDDAAKPLNQAPASVRQVAGPNVRLASNGLWRVKAKRGPDLFTHGPDPAPPPGPNSRLTDELPVGIGFEPGSAERAPICAEELNLQVLYARPTGSPDRLAEFRPQLQAAVRRMNAVLDAESLDSGGPDADYRVRCDAAGQVAVDGIASSGYSFSEVVSAARAAGYDSTQTEYLVFYDGLAGGACGIGTYRSDERLSADNLNNRGGGYGVVYSGCWFGETPMHESAHTMGAVQYSSPNSTGSGGHCIDEVDVMCYSPDGGDLNQSGVTVNCIGATRFDCGHDDYFDSAPEPGEYLESHWNLGSPLNRFLTFTEGSPTPAPTPAPDSSEPATESLGTGGKDQGASGTPGAWRNFQVRVPKNASTLRVRIFAAPNADVALYVRQVRKPTENLFKCRETLSGRHATCRIDDPDPGRWWAGVFTRGGSPGLGYKIRAKTKR